VPNGSGPVLVTARPEPDDLDAGTCKTDAPVHRAESALCAMVFTSERFVRYSMRLLAWWHKAVVVKTGEAAGAV
jgi:hypothetical protein